MRNAVLTFLLKNSPFAVVQLRGKAVVLLQLLGRKDGSMPHPHETAYPRLKSTVTETELTEIYTPTVEEITFAEAHTQSETAKVGLLLLLKTFQRLGYFLPVVEIPQRIVRHITRSVGLVAVPDGLATYDTSHTRIRHLSLIRTRLQITAYSRAVRPSAEHGPGSR